ncbi:hypothetical protein IV203_027567 [Nitzschia inconspicua]|uniref:Uncharacterized protein n=1 Tax=Nitzschia inconspicua TaxID=303405 RepID=A0A9K3Q3U3_9STRA|nr:hypothetical protein IV203_027567 [Nitzschia inconspicua]
MTMIPISAMNVSLPETSPSASSFKKPMPSENGKVLTSSQHKKRRGAGDLLRISRHKQKEQLAAAAPVEPKPQSKKVSFARTAKVKKVRSRQHYTDEERDNTWYSAEEYIAIKKRAVQTLRMMMADPSFRDDLEHTSRGLECRTKDAARTRKEFKAHSRELVLEEQENQREAGVHSPGRLRNSYFEMSMTAMRQARVFAQRDEEERVNEPLDYIIRVVKFENGLR